MLTLKKLEVEGVKLAYAEAGTGRPLVCVHGNFASKRWFTPQLVEPPEGWRVLALDLPNFADSDALPGAISIEGYAEYLKGFIDGLELERPVLLGHSLGGAVVQTLVSQAPELAAALLLIAPAPPNGFKTPEETYTYLELFKTNRSLLAQSLGATMPTRKPSYFEAIVDDAFNMSGAAFTGNARALERYDVTLSLSDIDCSALVLHGGRDYLVTEAMAQRTAKVLRGKLELWPDVGHSPQLESPQAFNTLLAEFLQGVS